MALSRKTSNIKSPDGESLSPLQSESYTTFIVDAVLHYNRSTVGVQDNDLAFSRFEANATLGAALPAGFAYPTAASTLGLGNTHGVIRFKVAVPQSTVSGNVSPASQAAAESSVKATLESGSLPAAFVSGTGGVDYLGS